MDKTEPLDVFQIRPATPLPEVLLTPNIGVIGVGGAGGNAVNNMIRSKVSGVNFFVANTDAQALSKSLCAEKIQLGIKTTQGLGAGAHPEVGKASAEESADKIREEITGLHLLFLTAGMGGGTGTGALPVIAKMAHEMGIMTVAVVSTPFSFEGPTRMRTAKAGIEEVKKYVDTMMVVPNQNLFRVATEMTLFEDAFKMADDVLCQGVKSITDLIINPGIVNLDFADLTTVLKSMGRAMIGYGVASGENRATVAVEKALSNPLLDDNSMKGARSVLFNICSAPRGLTLAENDFISRRIEAEADPNANLIWGTSFDESLGDSIQVSIVATGLDPVAVKDKPVLEAQPDKGILVTPPVSPVPPVTVTSVQTEQQSTQEEGPTFPNVDFGFGTVGPVIAAPDEDLVVEGTEKTVEKQETLLPDTPPVLGETHTIATPVQSEQSIDMASKTADSNVKSASGSNNIFYKFLGPLDKIGKSKSSSKLKEEDEPSFPGLSIPSFLK